MAEILEHRIAHKIAAKQTHSELLHAAHEVAALVERESDAIDANADLTPKVVEALRASGLFWMTLPPEIGGSDADVKTAIEVMEEIARADGSTGWSFFCNVVATSQAYSVSTDAGVATLFGGDKLPVLCGQFGPVGKAVPVEGGYRVSGKHQFASGSINATWFAASQTVYDESGKQIPGEDGQPLTTICYFPREKIRLTGNWDVAALVGTGSVDYEVPEQFVPKEMIVSGSALTSEGASRISRGGPFIRLGSYATGNFGHCAVALGMAKRALQEIARIASSKRRFGARDTISQSELFKYDYVMAEAEYSSTRVWLINVAQELENTRSRGLPYSAEQAARVLQVNHVVHRNALDIIRRCHSWAGSAAIRNPSAISRLLRDISGANNHVIVDRSHVVAAAPAVIDKWLGANEVGSPLRTSVNG